MHLHLLFSGSFGILPSMQCVICKAMFHAKCQGMISPNLRVFKCRRCMSRRSQQPLQPRAFPQTANDSSTVKLKLPMMPKVLIMYKYLINSKLIFG